MDTLMPEVRIARLEDEVESLRAEVKRLEGLKCTACLGTGRMPDTQNIATGTVYQHFCRACGGTGRIRGEK